MDTLRHLAEISITIAGFSALITLFQNKGTEWQFIDKNNLNRLYIMVEVSLATCLFSFLPVLLTGYLSQQESLRIASLTLALFWTIYTIFVTRRNQAITGTKNPGGKGTIFMKVLAIITVLVSLFNGLALIETHFLSNYTVVIFTMVGSTFYFFLRIIYSSIKIPKAEE